MIYCIPSEDYPIDESVIEELVYSDENDFEWRIARTENGFVVRYFGNEYFKEESFECNLSNGDLVRVKNTNCILFLDSDFETFCEVRDVIKSGYTDDIWDVFEELFTERFECCGDMLDSEILN